MEFFIIWIVCSVVGYLMADEGDEVTGAALGLLLGPLGVIIMLFKKNG